jgi:hypothetical protein
MKTGNWDGFTKMLNDLPSTIPSEIKSSLKKVAYKVQRSMITGLTSKRFNLAPNAESTIRAKKSSTPLIDKGDLIGSINVHNLPDGYLTGVHRTALSRDGKSLANVFAIHTFGNSRLEASGKRSGIPKRDIITPSLKENEAGFVGACEEALNKAFRIT